MKKFILTATALLSFTVSIASFAQVPSSESPAAAKAVLVTGASSGIGRKITEHLAGRGYFVYAGARKQADLDALGAIKNVRAVKLDVTKQEDIDAGSGHDHARRPRALRAGQQRRHRDAGLDGRHHHGGVRPAHGRERVRSLSA
jgi:NAD(P)-dependent dehydrogenase (short-subunit alcohol dehydrogenase family)